jgi:hypothetical protein
MNAPLLEEIATLYEREHGAIAMVDTDALAEIRATRRELIARLGPLGPAERAADAALTRLGGALSRLMRGRAALAGYRTSTPGSSVLSRALDKEV